MAPSEFPWEQEALDFIKEKAGPGVIHAWSNFEFVAPGGNIYEVDLMVLTLTQIYLIEIKSWSGVLEGTANNMQRRQGGGEARTVPNPLLLLNKKAKVLKGLLEDQPSMRGKKLPYTQAILFFNNPALKIKMAPQERANIYHHYEILEALKPAKRDMSDPTRMMDKSRVTALGKALKQLGIRRPNRTLRVGEWLLDDLLEDTPRYQDHLAHHTTIQESFRRVRTYIVPVKAPEAEQELARRAARREFQLTDSLHHPGILKPLELVYHEYGPALVYFYDRDAERLDHFLSSRASTLGLRERLELVRQLADILRYAHARRVYHRGLAAQTVLVLRPDSERPQLQVMNWQTGMELEGTAGTSHVSDLMDNAAKAYLAPEAFNQPAAAAGDLVDIFGLGAVAYHILTGEPPAESHIALYQRLMEHQGLRLSAVEDGLGGDLELLVELSTHPQVSQRPASVEEFLDLLEEASKRLLVPPEEQVQSAVDAQQGDSLPGGYLVVRQLGKGAVARALEVVRDGQSYVLKVAHEQGHNERMLEEATALEKLDHPHIVKLIGKEEIDGRVCLVLQKAGSETLSHRLAERGPLQLELLQRFGDDLLSAALYLEKVGIRHRDIKPANLGVTLLKKDDALHLMLFDFSLTSTAVENIGAGTPDYIDPFLKLTRPPRWDQAAERYSVAVTLYEMATGTLPRWGDGKSDPGLDPQAALVLEPERFDPTLRESLTEFFQKALARERGQRFDNAEDMLAAWKKAFKPAGGAVEAETVDPEELRQRLEAASLQTSLASLGLGTRVLRALDRLGALTVEELLALPGGSLHTAAGVGASTRKELVALQELLLERFGEDEVAPELEEEHGGVLEALLEGVVGKKSGDERDQKEGFLGLKELGRLRWPSLPELAAELKLEPAKLARKLPGWRRGWAKLSTLAGVRLELFELLSEQGGVMTAEEAAVGLLTRHGALSNDPDRRRRMAAAVARAAVEAEQTQAESRFLWQRVGAGMALGLSEPYLRYAQELGKAADENARKEPLPSPQRVLQELRAVLGPVGTGELSPHRLLRVAAECSQAAAVSSREELYPRGMEAQRALILAHGVLVGETKLTPSEVRERVLNRYPESQPLPPRPALDAMLEEADSDLRWSDKEEAYLRRFAHLATSSGSTFFQRFSTTAGTRAPGSTPEVAEARRFEERLQHAMQDDAFLVLMVEPQSVAQAEEELRRRFPQLARRCLDRMLVEAMREVAASRRIQWERVLEADAEPGGSGWKNLMRLLSEAEPKFKQPLLSAEAPQLLVHASLLARYGLLGVLEELRDAAGARGGVPAVWVLLPSERPDELPTLGGQAVATLNTAQQARIPTSWLENLHRAAGSEVLS